MLSELQVFSGYESRFVPIIGKPVHLYEYPSIINRILDVSDILIDQQINIISESCRDYLHIGK